MRRSVFVAALAAVAFLATACSENTGPAAAKRNRPGVAHVPSFTTATTGSGATLTTDKDDYAPGEGLQLSGAGWQAGDVLDMHLDEAPQNHPPVDWTITVDATGHIADATYMVQATDAGVTFTITATSRATGDVATAVFTDTPLGLGSLCANVAGFGDAICPTANGATGVLSPSHYKQKVGTAATYQIVGATDAFPAGACAPGVEVTVRNTDASINSVICGTLAGSTITFSVQLPNDKCGTSAVSYMAHTASGGVPANANNDIILDGAKNGNATGLGGIAPTDADGNVIIPIQGVCPTQPQQPTPPTTSCVAITAVQGVAITPVTMVGAGGTGGPYTFSATGLPAGLTMAADGTISGTPTVSGTFNYAVTVTDNTGHSGTFNCSVVVNPPPTANCAVITAVLGVPITPVTLVGSGGVGGPYTFSAIGLPAGLSMGTDGKISGTPTASGTFNYTVTVTDNAGNTGTFNCSVTVNGAPTASCVSITAVQGVAITPVTMVGSGGTGGPYTFSATGLPAGLSMASDGTISGTPSVNGTFSYTVTVTDAAGHKGTVNCSVTVYPPPTASCVVITAIQGVAITPVTLTGTGGTGAPYTFTATGLPAGLSISTAGTISGTPTVSGTFSYTVTVKDKSGNAGAFNCSVTVGAPPSASCVSITAWKGAAITPVTLTGTGGAGGPYTFSATGLPAGLTMSSNGTISGTPTVTGTFTYTVTVADKNGNKGTFNCSVTVNSDGTPPVCTVYENANPPYMSYQDGGSGIVRLDITTNLYSNFNVTISPTPVGTTFSPAVPSQPYAMPTGTVIKFPSGVTGLIKVSATRINRSKSAQLTVKATDAAGHTVSCDPIQTTLTKLKQDDGDQTFNNLSYDEHFVRIENGGLKSMDVIVNGTTFKVKRLDDNEVRVLDVSSAMKHNLKNSITLSPNGKKGETADVTIGPTP